jgi:inosine-uridine nucleoside N-ribohydrolase
VDDQFAIAYACFSGANLNFEACYAAPFFNARSSGPADGMEKSYHEILRVLELVGDDLQGRVFRGATDYIDNTGHALESPAVADLITRALDKTKPGPLHVIGIAAATNLASAVLLEPKIIPHVRMIWLGGHPLYWPSADEFNLCQDIRAVQTLLNCGVSLTLVPCKNVAEHLRTTRAELREALPEGNKLCRFLTARFDQYLSEKGMTSKPLWDVAAIAVLVNPDWVSVTSEPSPLLTTEKKWMRGDASRHLVQIVSELRRDAICNDLFSKLATGSKGGPAHAGRAFSANLQNINYENPDT